MNIDEYKELSERTLSTNFHLNSKKTQDTLVETIATVIKNVDRLDQLKKVIYYGKDLNIENSNKYFDYKSFDCQDQQLQKVLHASIGLVTESVEILDQVFNSIKNNKEIDIVNVAEEIGDIDWYKAILLREYNLDESKIRTTNIEKLATRYGDKFDDFKAINRDLEKERDILEK